MKTLSSNHKTKRNFCVNITGSKCKPKSYVARYENTRLNYHIDLELSDRSWE